MKRAAYRGKSYQMPNLSASGVSFIGEPIEIVRPRGPVIRDLNSTWNLKKFLEPRKPLTVSILSAEERETLGTIPLPRVLDLPIKFPGSDYRLPQELAGLEWLIKRVADYEATINPYGLAQYYCYLTVDRGLVAPNTCLREAPCHVDGFQGARWQPKVAINHTYSVSDVLSTTFYIQPFDFSRLDDTKHDFFWEMNRQVNLSNSLYAWRPVDGALTLMDAYTVHRGSESPIPQMRTFVRISYEVRIFDRLGNAHNPMFDYSWEMVPRDIEELKLVAFDPQSDPSLRVFPHQDLTGKRNRKGVKTKPTLRPLEISEKRNLTWIPRGLKDRGWVYGSELRSLAS